MPRGKGNICISPTGKPLKAAIRVHGTGELRRLVVGFRAHAGPSPVKGRDVDLILNNMEALALAIDLIGALPTDVYSDPVNKPAINMLVKFVRMIQAEAEGTITADEEKL